MWRQLATALVLASSSSSWHMVLVGGTPVVAVVKEHTTSSTTRRALSTTTSSSTCTLPCQNGGVCMLKGQTPSWNTDTTGLMQGNATVLVAGEPTCNCTADYIGVFCNVRVQPCGLTGSLLCLYGSTCVQDGAGDYHCACNATTNAGASCQQHQTTVCNVPGRLPGQGAASFCVNDGVCDGTGGCSCPYGYGGPHCEYISGELVGASSSAALATSGKGRGNAAFAWAIVVVVVVLALVAGLLYRRHRKRRYEADRERGIVTRTLLGNTNPTTSGPFENPERKNIVLDMGPQHDFDGNELEEVEII